MRPRCTPKPSIDGREAPVEGVWFLRDLRAPDGTHSAAGVRALNATWKVDGRWIDDREPNDRDARVHRWARRWHAV